MARPINSDARPGQRVEDDDEDQDDRDQDMVLQVVEQRVDENRLVLRVGHFHAFRHGLHEGVGNGLGAVDRLDDVGADALLDLDGDRRLAVEPGDRLGILEGRAHRGEILHAHDGIRPRDHRQVGDVLRRLDQRRDFDRIFALGAFDRAGRDQAVRRAHAQDQLVEPQSVGGQLHRIDDRLDQLVTRSLEGALEHAGNFLDAVTQLLRRGRQRAFRHVAGQGDDQHRKFRDVDLVDGRLLDARRQVALGVLHLVASVDEGVA